MRSEACRSHRNLLPEEVEVFLAIRQRGLCSFELAEKQLLCFLQRICKHDIGLERRFSAERHRSMIGTATYAEPEVELVGLVDIGFCIECVVELKGRLERVGIRLGEVSAMLIGKHRRMWDTLRF